MPLPEHWGVQLYLKDESTHRSGSLKHRLARSLFLFGLVNGWIREGTTLVEASSGSTAVSEAYFAQLLGLPFIAVMTRTTSPEKIDLTGTTMTAKVSFGKLQEGVGYGLAVELVASFPETIDEATGKRLLDAAHELCPYSNATRGNIQVDLSIA